ncbi:unnamed protein product, partial [Symbiodinium pilosum]
DLLVSMRMALLYWLTSDAPFRFTDVRQLLILATQGILRTHRSAWQKHFIDLEAKVLTGSSNPTKGYGGALPGLLSGGQASVPMRDMLNQSFRKNGEEHAAQRIFPEEINAAVQDFCVHGNPRRRHKFHIKVPK